MRTAHTVRFICVFLASYTPSINGEPTVTNTVSNETQVPLSTFTMYEVVVDGHTKGLGAAVSLMLVAGVQVNVVPKGPVGAPPICTVSPRHMLVSGPAAGRGTGRIVIAVSMNADGQPQALNACTATVPAPTLGQLTTIEFDP